MIQEKVSIGTYSQFPNRLLMPSLYRPRNFFDALQPKRQFEEVDSPYTYVEASVTIDGVAFPNVGLCKKGFIGSQSTSRPSLKIRLNQTDKKAGIEGLTTLTFNNNKQDNTQMSQFAVDRVRRAFCHC